MQIVYTAIFSVVLFCVFDQANAQEHQVSVQGKVTDSNGAGLPGVSITLLGTSQGSMSDPNGQFIIESVQTGAYQLRATLVGFSTYLRDVQVKVGMLPVSLQLTEQLYALPEVVITRETLTGGSALASDIPGAAHIIERKELDKFNYSDVNRILRNIPGINMQEEEGFGLRPNIGIRGTAVERSSKITLMEDGILAAPAPYVAPAAYYFPTLGRMESVEVRKGSSQIKYGPYTTGGAINFISTPIPERLTARVLMSAASYGKRTLHATAGKSFKYGGFLIESYQQAAEGFKTLDNGGPTGFSSRDYLAKVRINTPTGAKVFQSLTLKVGEAKGNADETYLGLTDTDFSKTPYRRYAASQRDHIATGQTQFSFKYNIIPAKHVDVSITGYSNTVSRNWYKLDKAKYGAAQSVSIADILDHPDLHSDEYRLLAGLSGDGQLLLKNNNRKYSASGLQGVVGLNFGDTKTVHDVEVGFRYHEDREDRYQWEDVYAMEGGVMKLTTAGVPGTESNRISDATASAAYVQYTFEYRDHLHIIPGVRYESIDLGRKDFGKNDPSRTGMDLSEISNSVEAWIPGIGVAYRLYPGIHTFLGAHRGFSPPGVRVGTKAENSVNYELGTRIGRSRFHGQAVLFLNAYENLLGSDLAAAGAGGSGDQFNAGRARVYGVEIEAGHIITLDAPTGVSVPVRIAYTYTNGEFRNSFDADNEEWGNVEHGDYLPYLSPHQFSLSLGVDHRFFALNLSAKYTGEMRTTPGQGTIPQEKRISDNFIMDVSADARIDSRFTLFSSVYNLTDEVYIVARRPAGLRPGLPRILQLGLRMNFQTD